MSASVFYNTKKTAPFIILAVFLLIADRFLKQAALLMNNSADLLGDWFSFNFISNYNIAFSLPLSGRPLIVVIMTVILALIICFGILVKRGETNEAGLVLLIITGASSNLYDRLIYGYVVDYLDLDYFTAFNLADTAIVAAAIILAAKIYLKDRNPRNRSTNEP